MADNTTTVLVMKIITIVVAVLMIATVALPAIDVASQGNTVTGQNTEQSYSLVAPDSTVNISLSGGKAVVNGYTVPSVNIGIIAFSETFFIRLSGGSLQISVASGGTNLTYTASSYTISGGNVAFTVGTTDYSEPAGDNLYVAAESGEYGYFNPGTEIKFNKDATFYMFVGGSFSNADASPTSFWLSAILEGTADGLKSVMLLTAATAPAHQTDAISVSAFDYTENTRGYCTMTVPDLTLFTFTSDANVEYTYNTSYWGMVIAPIEYTYIEDNQYASLYGIIGVILLVVPVMMATRLMAMRRN